MACSAGESPHASLAYSTSRSASSYSAAAPNARITASVGTRVRSGVRALDRHDRPDRRLAAVGEHARREASVVRIQVIGGDDAVEGCGGRHLSELIARPRGPVQPRGPIVGAGKRRRGRLEHGGGLREVALLVRCPANLPRGPVRIPAARKPPRQLAEDQVRLVVFLGRDVVRRQVVERLLGPACCQESRSRAAAPA